MTTPTEQHPKCIFCNLHFAPLLALEDPLHQIFSSKEAITLIHTPEGPAHYQCINEYFNGNPGGPL